MTTRKYYTTKTEIAAACNVNRGTVYRWMTRGDFPTQTPKGWPANAVDSFAKSALEKAAQCQTGNDADLKRRKLELQIEILTTQLAQRKAELAVDMTQTVVRDVVLETIRAMSLATWAAMDANVNTHGNTELRNDPETFAALCGHMSEVFRKIGARVRDSLSESQAKFTPKEIEEVTAMFNCRW